MNENPSGTPKGRVSPFAVHNRQGGDRTAKESTSVSPFAPTTKSIPPSAKRVPPVVQSFRPVKLSSSTSNSMPSERTPILPVPSVSHPQEPSTVSKPSNGRNIRKLSSFPVVPRVQEPSMPVAPSEPEKVVSKVTRPKLVPFVTQGVSSGLQSGSESTSGVAGNVQGSLQSGQNGLEVAKAKEDKAHRSRKIKPLLPPAVLQPQATVSQSQSNGLQPQTVVPSNGGSHGKNKVIPPSIMTSSTLPVEDPAKDALKTTENILSELTPKKEDDRLDAITAESFFAPPPEESPIPVEPSADVHVLSPEPDSSPSEQSFPVATQQPTPLVSQASPATPQPTPATHQSAFTSQTSQPTPQPTPATPQSALTSQPSPSTPQPTPLVFSSPSELSPSQLQQRIPQTPLTTPVTSMTPQRPVRDTPLTPFIPKESSPLPSHQVNFACGPHHIATNLPHNNFSLLSFSSLDGPLTHGKKRDKVLQWLKMQEEATTDGDWKLLWGILRIHVESNGVLGSERSANTRDKLCALLMANTNYINDLPPRELPNPSPDTYASDLVSIQDLLLGGQRREAISIATQNNLWALAMVSAYLEGEDVFKEVCLQYCNQLLPQQNTLSLILPLILGNSKTSLEDVNLQGWSRMLSGLLAIVPKEAATALITEMGGSLQAQHRIIPAQICSILCGRELQSFTANPAFSLLGGEVVEEGPTGSGEDQEGALVACIAASEIYEYGLSLSNGMYRSRSLASVKLLHALHCEEKGLIEQARGYVEELNGFVKNYRVNNVSFQNQLELLRQRLGTEGMSEENNSLFGHLLSAVDKGINSIMATVEGEMSPQSMDSLQNGSVMAPIETMGQTVSLGKSTPALIQQTAPLIQQTAALSQQPIPSQPPVEPQPEPVVSRRTPVQRHSHRADSFKRPFIPFIPTTPLSEINPETKNSMAAEVEKPVIEETSIRDDSPKVSEDAPHHVLFAAPIPMKTESAISQALSPAVPKETPLESHQVQPQPKPIQSPSKPTTPTEAPKKEERSSWSLFGSLFGRSESGKKVYKVELPKEEVKPYYDEVKKKWIIPGVEEEEEAAPLPPPPPMISAPVQSPDSTKPVQSTSTSASASTIKPIEPMRPPVQPLMPIPVAHQREENEQSDQIQPNQCPPLDQPSPNQPQSSPDQSHSSPDQSNQPQPQTDPSPSQPRRQNKRVAKSKPKSRPMTLYANPFYYVCVQTKTILHCSLR